jgi:hypothetical protein
MIDDKQNRQSDMARTLTASLVADLAPVAPLLSPLPLAILFGVIAIALSIVGLTLFGEWRESWVTQMGGSPRLALEIVTGIVGVFLAGYCALELSLPTLESKAGLRALALSPLLILVLHTLLSWWHPSVEHSWEGWRFGCEREILAIGIVPCVLLMWAAKYRLPLDGRGTGFFIGVASTLPAAVGMQLACMYQPWHTFLFHLLPVVLAGYLCSRVLK